MCTRYIPPSQAELESAWHIGRHNQPRWAHEVFPRALGPFLRLGAGGGLDLVVGSWGLIPAWSKTSVLKYSTCNCRSEEAAEKPTFRDALLRGQRCIIPALSFDEPCWETGRNVWWRFRRADGLPWGLAGLWNTWVDRSTGEVVESYTMLTVNADAHPLMNRMHKPDPKLPPDQQDKRSVVAIEPGAVAQWLQGSRSEAAKLLVPPAVTLIEAGPA
ncbi:MAG: SOS response-associated peptidase family protein [Azonexus sp.]|jgi:putative SOS response-associated peptidase YedK|nr:SOS response-associated peptidase family protein [Azonexus sp.]